jgi:O-antigen/teichoic acid export membrane protein
MGSIVMYAWCWLGGTLVASVLGLVVAWHYHIRSYRSTPVDLSWGEAREIFQYSLWALLANNASLLLSQIDMQLLYQIAGPVEAGFYSNYLSLIAIPFMFLTPILSLFLPATAQYLGAGQVDRVRTAVTGVRSLFISGGILAVVLSAIFAESLSIFLF